MQCVWLVWCVVHAVRAALIGYVCRHCGRRSSSSVWQSVSTVLARLEACRPCSCKRRCKSSPSSHQCATVRPGVAIPVRVTYRQGRDRHRRSRMQLCSSALVMCLSLVFVVTVFTQLRNIKIYIYIYIYICLFVNTHMCTCAKHITTQICMF